MQVFKFGGASVKDAEAVRNVASIVRDHATGPTVIVVSAMGKMTNRLEDLVNAYYHSAGDAQQILTDIRDFHLAIVRELFDASDAVFSELENVFVELQWGIEEAPAFSYSHHYDQLVSQGEILSSRIVSAYLARQGLRNSWLDARDVIQTDNNYREGGVDFVLSATLADSVIPPLAVVSPLIVTQGFIGGTSENFTTTLGREGSDYSAALFAYITNAERVVIWKDVAGVLNADPKFFKNTTKIAEMSYHDAIELTYYGASVIHPRTIKPLQNKNIPLEVRSFVHPSEPGTLISESAPRNTLTSYIFKDRQILISIMPKDFSFIAEDNLSEIFRLFSIHRVRVNMMQNSALSFSVCVDHDPLKTDALLEELRNSFRVLYNEHVQLMTIRNYDAAVIARLSEGKSVLLEQRSRTTFQMVLA